MIPLLKTDIIQMWTIRYRFVRAKYVATCRLFTLSWTKLVFLSWFHTRNSKIKNMTCNETYVTSMMQWQIPVILKFTCSSPILKGRINTPFAMQNGIERASTRLWMDYLMLVSLFIRTSRLYIDCSYCLICSCFDVLLNRRYFTFCSRIWKLSYSLRTWIKYQSSQSWYKNIGSHNVLVANTK